MRYSLNEKVKITVSGEQGLVIGRAEYLHGETMYQVRYRCADGRAVEAWWAESAIESA